MIRVLTVLGLESSCDDTAAAVVRGRPEGPGEILSSVVIGQGSLHAAYGGIVPELAARAHAERLDSAAEAALNAAGLPLGAMDGVAVTAGPGLIGGVLAGVMCAKGLAAGAGLPLIGVNHLAGHALTPRLTDGLAYPYLTLLVSGGHCQFLRVRGSDAFDRLGGTIDDAPGEAFDKTAKLLGLGYPGGPALSRLAEQGTPGRYRFPRPMLDSGDLEFSFSGLKTAVSTLLKKEHPAPADLARGFVDAVTEVLVSKCVRALETTGLTRLVVAGGVGANRQLRAALDEKAASGGFDVFYPEPELCTDNGAMIAFAAALRLRGGALPGGHRFSVRPRWDLAA